MLCNNPDSRWAAYHDVAEKYMPELPAAEHALFQLTLQSMLKFWDVVNGKERKPIEFCTGSEQMVPLEEWCTVLNTTFALSFASAEPDVVPHISDESFSCMGPIVIDWVGVWKLIDNLKLPCSPAVDGIKPKLLKNTETFSSIIFSSMFSRLWPYVFSRTTGRWARRFLYTSQVTPTASVITAQFHYQA